MTIASLSLVANEHATDIIDYDLKADFDNITGLLKVNLNMKVGKLTDNKIDFIFTHHAKIEAIYLQVGKSKKNVAFHTFSSDSISLTLPDNTDLSEQTTIVFDYSIPVDSVSGSKSCVYTLTRPEKWYPLLYNELSTHIITVSVPENYSALSTGDMIKKVEKNKRKVLSWSDKYNYTCPLFIFKTDSLKGIKKISANKNIDFYFYSCDTLIQNNYTKIVCGSFQYFYNLFDKDYPYNTYSFIEIPDYPAGSALGSLQMFGTTPVSDFTTYGMLYCLKPAAHEVAHEWWGVGHIHYKDKTNDGGLQFLRESMNEYLTFMFIEHYWGSDSLAKCLKIADSYYKTYVNDSNERNLFEIPQQYSSWEEAVVIYYKGPLIVHELRKMLGDENWVGFIKRFYFDFRNKYATIDDFYKTLSVFDTDGHIVKTLDNYLKTKGFKQIEQKQYNRTPGNVR